MSPKKCHESERFPDDPGALRNLMLFCDILELIKQKHAHMLYWRWLGKMWHNDVWYSKVSILAIKVGFPAVTPH